MTRIGMPFLMWTGSSHLSHLPCLSLSGRIRCWKAGIILKGCRFSQRARERATNGVSEKERMKRAITFPKIAEKNTNSHILPRTSPNPFKSNGLTTTCLRLCISELWNAWWPGCVVRVVRTNVPMLLVSSLPRQLFNLTNSFFSLKVALEMETKSQKRANTFKHDNFNQRHSYCVNRSRCLSSCPPIYP